MSDLKLGIAGQGSIAATRAQMEDRSPEAARGKAIKGYDEVKTYISGLRQDVTLRVKYGSGTGEMALGKESRTARFFKGDRSELTAETLAKTVEKRFGAVAGEKFKAVLQDADGNLDLHRDKVLSAFREVETMMGLGNRVGAFERRDFPVKTGEAAVKTFVDHYPSRYQEGQGIPKDGMLLSGRFYGDIVRRGHAVYENGVLNVGRGLQGRTEEQNFEALKSYFSNELGIDPNDKVKMQNAMNNVLNFFEQNCYNTAAGEASDRLNFYSGAHEIEFEGTISFDGTDLQMKRSVRTELKEIVVLPRGGGGAYDRLTGWRYQAEDGFRIPLEATFVPNAEFKPEAMVDASRMEFVERGQRTVTIED